MSKPLGSPDCFGSHLWSATEKECIGGPDPGYAHPVSGARVRERCRWYQSCASVSAQNKLVPSQSLVRAPAVQPPIPQAIPPGVQAPPKPVAPNPVLGARPPLHVQQPSFTYQPQPVVQAGYPQQQQLQQYMSYAPPYVAQLGPAQIPMPYQQPGAQMPAYLTMPEPVRPGDSALGVLARTLFRAALKAIGHALASFVDHTPIKPHSPPE